MRRAFNSTRITSSRKLVSGETSVAPPSSSGSESEAMHTSFLAAATAGKRVGKKNGIITRTLS